MARTRTENRIQLHTHVEPETRDALSALARANDRSVSAEIRRALAIHVKQANPRENE
jgi:predicted transcriptional regulator